MASPMDSKDTRPWDSPGRNTGVGCHFLLQCMKVKRESEVAQSCLTLSDPMDCSPPGPSVHGIFQARVLEWGAIAFSDSIFKIAAKPGVQATQPEQCLISQSRTAPLLKEHNQHQFTHYTTKTHYTIILHQNGFHTTPYSSCH